MKNYKKLNPEIVQAKKYEIGDEDGYLCGGVFYKKDGVRPNTNLLKPVLESNGKYLPLDLNSYIVIKFGRKFVFGADYFESEYVLCD